MLRALLFDMNGVMVDDMAFHERAWLALAARHGKVLTLDEFRRQLSGRRNWDNLRHVFGEPSREADMAAFQVEKEEAYRAAFRPHLALLPGLRELLGAARAAGWRLAVATSAPPENIDFVLDGLDVRSCFDAVVGEAEVKQAESRTPRSISRRRRASASRQRGASSSRTRSRASPRAGRRACRSWE